MPDPVGPPGLQSAMCVLLLPRKLDTNLVCYLQRATTCWSLALRCVRSVSPRKSTTILSGVTSLQGILVAQTYHYWKSYGNKDSRIFRILVRMSNALKTLRITQRARTADARYLVYGAYYTLPTTATSSLSTPVRWSCSTPLYQHMPDTGISSVTMVVRKQPIIWSGTSCLKSYVYYPHRHYYTVSRSILVRYEYLALKTTNPIFSLKSELALTVVITFLGRACAFFFLIASSFTVVFTPDSGLSGSSFVSLLYYGSSNMNPIFIVFLVSQRNMWLTLITVTPPFPPLWLTIYCLSL